MIIMKLRILCSSNVFAHGELSRIIDGTIIKSKFRQMNMFGNLKEQIKEAQLEMKQKLEQMEINGDAMDGRVKVVVNGNRKILSIDIDAELYQEVNRDELQELVKQASNMALDKAEKVGEEEMMNSAKGILPGMSGLFG